MLKPEVNPDNRINLVRVAVSNRDNLLRPGMPADPEFRSALVGYLEWGSRIAVLNSHATENPVADAEPMPKWGWGETGGPYTPGNR